MIKFAKLKSIFLEKYVPPIVYRRVLDRQYGGEWVSWEPETLWAEVRDDTGAEISDEVRDKINALRILLTTKNFWSDFPVFENVIIAFNDRFVDPSLVQVCTPEELAYGLTVAGQIVEHPFSQEVKDYVRGCCIEDGLAVYHRSFRFAQPDYQDGYRRELRNAVDREWQQERFTQIKTLDENEHHPVMIQVGKLHDIEAYVRERLDRGYEKEIAA